MEELLRGVHLKSVNVVEQDVDLAHQLKLEVEQNIKLRAVDLESWYHKITPFTYKTYFVDLSMEQARAIIQEYPILQSHSDSTSWRESKPLIELKQKIQQTLEQNHLTQVFAKLSSRSPKDSRKCQQKAKEVALSRLQQLQATQTLSTNDLVQAIMASGIEVLKMESAEEILETFLTSDRVCEDDLPLALQFPDRWSQHIVIREWITIPIQYEFRAFVFNNKMTSLSQYFNNAYFPELIEEKEKILQLVQELFENVRDLLGIDPPDYVLDIAVQLEEKKAFVIELNPFGKPDGLGTGTCLFDKTNPEDLKILFGESDFEFRLEEKPTTVIPSKYIRGDWKEFFIEHGLIES